MLTFIEIVAVAQEAMAIIDDAERNGVVNTSGYTDDSYPIGGHFTNSAMGLNAEAQDMLDSIGASSAPF